MKYRGFELYPFQADAVESIRQHRSVLVSAPTGAGKTVVAEYAIERGLRHGERVVYTSPVKALSNQKYRDFSRLYPGKIGLMTGDLTLNPEAPVLIMTAEIFRNTIFEEDNRLHDVSYLIMDEVHYLSDVDRGTVWEESIIFAPKGVRFVGLSATIPNMEQFRAWMSEVRGEEVDLVHTDDRPVPLRHFFFVPGGGPCRASGLKKAMGEARRRRQPPRGESGLVRHLIEADLLPALFFCFSRKECESRARYHRRQKLLKPEDRARVLELFDESVERFGLAEAPGVDELRHLASHGILFHHAGMLPLFKEIVESLFTTGLVKLLFTTETFAVGVNMPARSVAFASLRKFDGVDFNPLQTLQYYQMAGRAGRQGLDEEGQVFSVVDTKWDTPAGLKKIVFGKVEPLRSRFNLSYSGILNLYRDLGEELDSAVDRSFAAYQRGGHSERTLALLRARLETLRSCNYLQGEGLGGKGRVASRINGYEIQVTQCFWDGLFEGLPPEHCAQLVAGIVHTSRRREPSFQLPMPELGDLRRKARRAIQEFRRVEKKRGVLSQVKAPDWSLGAAMQAWTRGATFEELEGLCEIQPGDLVRSFRMCVQVIRQFAWAVRDDKELCDRLWEAYALINRDEVDAELQLRLGSGEESSDKPRTREEWPRR